MTEQQRVERFAQILHEARCIELAKLGFVNVEWDQLDQLQRTVLLEVASTAMQLLSPDNAVSEIVDSYDTAHGIIVNKASSLPSEADRLAVADALVAMQTNHEQVVSKGLFLG